VKCEFVLLQFMLHHVKTILSVSVWFLIGNPASSQSFFNYVGVISWAQGARELGDAITGGGRGIILGLNICCPVNSSQN